MCAHARVFTFHLHETVFGGMGRDMGRRRQKDDFRGLDEPQMLS